MQNSRLLVFLQFLFLSLMFTPMYLISFEYAWIGAFICLSLALKLLLWTSGHNKIGNFNIVPEIKEKGELIQSGPYKYIRHPMYTSVLLIGLGALFYSFAFFKIFVLMALVGVLVLKARKEEGYWCEKDETYQAYKEKTKMFIPFVL
ncbi:isoprenylcysteine carboxylmethyltransferase family protein [Sulfurimonas sp. MAG313]|nr:isoprenylcysteine carboxylmethyltransferase family protein [Sulfurimonas sp. MAG313]MDF1881625.1 isoprenylcysteine carboxylmethyltransferase family protein [Sulfurimonas sp. MAG313]